MKTRSIEVGGRYTAKVSGAMVVLRVRSIFTRCVGNRDVMRFECVNESTGRNIVVRSPQRFRAPVGKDER